MTPVTDPSILAQLEGGAPKPVTDPALLAQLEGKPATAMASPRSSVPLSDPGNPLSFTTGNVFKGLANVAGMPVDVGSQAINLSRAYRGVTSGRPQEHELVGPQVGGSQWIQDLMRRTKLPFSGQPMIPPSAEPESPLGRYAASAIQMGTGAGIPGAAMGRIAQPTRSLPNVPRAVTGGAASGVTAEAAGDIGGEEYKPLGAMVPQMRGASRAPGPGERATAARREEDFRTGREMGIPIPPRAMKDNPIQQKLQDQANIDMKQPPGSPVTPEVIKNHNLAQWKAYETVIKDPALAQGVKPNPEFRKTIKDIGDEITRTSTEMPQTFKGMRPVLKLLEEYGYGAAPPQQYSAAVLARNPQLAQQAQATGKPIPPDLAMRAIKKLREDASTNFQSEKAEKIELAHVQKKIANAVEQLIEANLPAQSPAVQQFREARTAIAKGHDYLDALDPATRQIDPMRLSKLQTEGRPLSGQAADIAQVSGAFPEAMKPGGGGDILTHRMSPHAALHPGNWLVHLLQRATDPVTTSRPYQAGFVDPRAKSTPEQQRIQALLAAAMAQQQGGQIPLPR